MSCACSGFRIICLFSVFSTEVLLLAHLQTSVSKVRFRRLVRKFYYLRTCRLPYLRPVFKVWDGSFSHCIPTNLRRERVKGISGCQGRLSGAACSGLRSLTAVFRVFDSLYTRLRTLFDCIAYVEGSIPSFTFHKKRAGFASSFFMERVNRNAFVDASNFNGSRDSVLISSNFC